MSYIVVNAMSGKIVKIDRNEYSYEIYEVDADDENNIKRIGRIEVRDNRADGYGYEYVDNYGIGEGKERLILKSSVVYGGYESYDRNHVKIGVNSMIRGILRDEYGSALTEYGFDYEQIKSEINEVAEYIADHAEGIIGEEMRFDKLEGDKV